ncbi:MAG: peptidylprolyl isomerase [Desulfobacterales bacterium]|nr:peptidylprolyl isomerase [Desulfobacteraceae bacterium]MDD3990987.1 peptidylprolyl isomerase [Desulfobacteraceae bacterium]MDY0311908.1 peptidylprolyl isomerase [Desulfobacterales bacterium]
MRGRSTLMAVLMAGLMGMGAAGMVSAQEAKTEARAASDAAVATVNGETISNGQLDRELAGIQGRMARQGQPVPDEALAQIRGRVLDQLIGETLLFQESQKLKIRVDDQKIQGQIDEMAQGFEDKAAFDLALANAGLSREVLTERLGRQMAIQQLIEEKIVAGVQVAEARADEFYKANPEVFVQPEQVRARHILIRTEAEADAAAKTEARKQIDGLRQKAVDGADFAELAKTHSQDPGSKEKGGDLGFFARGQMVKPFEDTAFALKENEISQVVESPFGFHLIQVTGRKPAETVAYETVKPRILEHLKQQAIREKLDAYVDGLRQGAKIEKFI